MTCWMTFYNGVRHRPYFFSCFIVFVFLYGLIAWMYRDWQWASALLLAWNLAIGMYLLLTLTHLWRTPQRAILVRAQQQDASKWLILVLVCLSLLMCVVAIVVELSHMPQEADIKLARVLLSVWTVVSAWLFIHTVFAIHYAHDFYLAVNQQLDGGLDFPKTTTPTYPDFLYFSYVIGTSAQTADVSITNRSMRVLNLLHILLAYGFNTTILAIAINIAAGYI